MLPEPPYYAVVFTSHRRPGDHGYAEAADRMEELVRAQPGFLGMDSARDPGGLGITVGYFKDERSIRAWREHVEHAAARERGRARWYEDYTVHVARVERSYAFTRSVPAEPEGPTSA